MDCVTAFRRCSVCFVRSVYWLPVAFVVLVELWGYYVYVYVMNISGTFPKGHPVVNALLVLVAHVIMLLQLISYFRTIFSRHKKIPDEFYLTDEQFDRMEDMVDSQPLLREVASNLPVHTVTTSGMVRYCPECELIKPDRCHHCSVCDRCVMKMDHHCPWVNNCVGFSNYKFFVLFLFYTVLLATWLCVSGIYDFVRAWKGTLEGRQVDKFNVIFCFFVSGMFGFSTGILLIFHIYLTLFNRTTIENMRSPALPDGADRRLYFLGFKKNVQQVFGKRVVLALLPVRTSEGDGVRFEMRRRCPEAGFSRRDDERSGEESEVEIFPANGIAEAQPLRQSTDL